MTFPKNNLTKNKNTKRPASAPDPNAALAAYEPPSAIEAETALLAAMLLFPAERERWCQEMTEADFYRLHHQSIFRLICEMNRDGRAVDLVTFLTEAEATARLEECGGRGYLAVVFTQDAYQAHTPQYSQQIRGAAARRRITDAAALMLEASLAGEDAEALASRAEALVTSAPLTQDAHTKDARQILKALTLRLEARADNPRAMIGTPTGFGRIDGQTNGLQAPNLIVIAARPSCGKSALVTAIAANVARVGTPVFVASLEMSYDEVMMRMICSAARLSSHRVNSGRMEADEWDRYNRAASALYEAPLEINDRSGATPNYLRGEIRKVIRKHGGIGLIIVDYLQLMRADSGVTSRYDLITEVSTEMKALAKEFSAPVIALSQLSRECEKRPDKRGQLSDLRESGQIEQDADIVAFLYRDSLYDPNRGAAKDLPDPYELERLPTELIFRKHRNGPVGTVMLDFVEPYALFLDAEDMPRVTGF